MTLAVAIVALLVAAGSLLVVQRNWLTLAATERTLAETDRSLAASFSRTRPEQSAERLAMAERHELLAVKYARRARPFKRRDG